MTCSHCHGEGQVRVSVHGLREGRAFCEWQMMTCSFCGGLGTMDSAQAAAEARGQHLREDRVARRLSLREEAARLGITARELSDKEWGRSSGD